MSKLFDLLSTSLDFHYVGAFYVSSRKSLTRQGDGRASANETSVLRFELKHCVKPSVAIDIHFGEIQRCRFSPVSAKQDAGRIHRRRIEIARAENGYRDKFRAAGGL